MPSSSSSFALFLQVAHHQPMNQNDLMLGQKCKKQRALVVCSPVWLRPTVCVHQDGQAILGVDCHEVRDGIQDPLARVGAHYTQGWEVAPQHTCMVFIRPHGDLIEALRNPADQVGKNDAVTVPGLPMEHPQVGREVASNLLPSPLVQLLASFIQRELRLYKCQLQLLSYSFLSSS